MAISRRLRFEVLRRDNYTCRYCGAKAPEVEVTVDHVIPATLGGADDPSNLVTACWPCNAGKSSIPPDAGTVAAVADDAIRWRRAMERDRIEFGAERELVDDLADEVLAAWHCWTYTDEGGTNCGIPLPLGWRESVERLLSAGADVRELVRLVEVAMVGPAVPEKKFRYFCGCAWRVVSDLQESARRILESEGAHGQD